jgi:hypothetical protein
MYDTGGGGASMYDTGGGDAASMYDAGAGASMYDTGAPTEPAPSGFGFVDGGNGGAPAEEQAPASGFGFVDGSGAAAEPAPSLVGAAPQIAAPPSTGNLDADLAQMKAQRSELIQSQVDALTQCAALRKQSDKLRKEIDQTNEAVEEAGASEDYERAEALQAEAEAKTQELTTATQKIAAYEARRTQAEAAVENIVRSEIELREKVVEKLRGARAEQEAACADFVSESGPKLQVTERRVACAVTDVVLCAACLDGSRYVTSRLFVCGRRRRRTVRS